MPFGNHDRSGILGDGDGLDEGLCELLGEADALGDSDADGLVDELGDAERDVDALGLTDADALADGDEDGLCDALGLEPVAATNGPKTDR